MTNAVTHWLKRRRLVNPAYTDRGRFTMPLAEIVAEIAAPEADVVEALTAGGYTVREGRVDMLRYFWRTAIAPAAHDTPTRRRHIDTIAAAWDRQLGEADVQLALRVGGELREAIRAALAPAEPTAAALAKFIAHGRARGDRWAFMVTNIKPRTYAARQFERIYA